ncbi:UDP-N-acetylglucosamine pyrophosphorylase [Halorubrum salipaludis]|uniref:UDP-N-acetylglucosamine pyrophosphorylase n=1 Tax=Halorubrum salipaludis TaxID=2032630 RepID=A0A2A2FFS6_9EURY|nr:nucleotidyltransferase family protein [Halorubrum salipaludis]PAU84361.1 UDP-N-acetylglucosamine pyrophosphorylase [Halorubrum salipaludis]
MTDDGLPTARPPFEADDAGPGGSLPERESGRDPDRVGGVLLAAGTSSRFGDANKLLATVDGEPIVRRAARTLAAAGLARIVAVVGHEAPRVRAALSDLPIETVENDAYAAGQSASLRAGIEALSGGSGDEPAVDAAVVALGDMPFVEPATIETLVAAYAAGAGDALAAAHDGERGNPVLFDARFFDRLTAVDGDVGGRAILLGSDASALVAVDDPGVRRDVDRPRDLPDDR